MAAIDTGLSIGPIVHENAHMLLNLSDLYDTRYGSHGVGYYALMGYGCLLPSPTPINAFYRNKLGWEEATDITNVVEGTVFNHVANSTTSFIYQNPNNSREHFYIESRTRSGNYVYQADEGLMIWHVDEWSFFQNPDMTSNSHYYVSLEQADGNFDMEEAVNGGDSTDLFKKGLSVKFNESTTPNSDWWKDGGSGLQICNISDVGDTMSFEIGNKQTEIKMPEKSKTSITFKKHKNKMQIHSSFLIKNIRLYNSQGKQVYKEEINSMSKTIQLKSSLSRGVYYADIHLLKSNGISHFNKLKFICPD